MEDGLFANLVIFDYLYYMFVGREKGWKTEGKREGKREGKKGKEKGKGKRLTHWTSLARVIRAEALQVSSADYVQLSRRLGKPSPWIARHHMVPHIMPQLLVGLILLFPHAILHEAALSFIGIGLSPHLPAIGIILAESMRHLSTGYWWLGVMPGVLLLLSVKAFDWLGENVRSLLDPKTSQG